MAERSDVTKKFSSSHPVKVVFFGTDNISIPTLKALIDDPQYQVVGVVTKPDSASGRRHKLVTPEAAQVAKANNILCLQPRKLRDVKPQLESLHADVGVVVSYGKIIPESVIHLFPHGIINFHPSLLPVYRGPSPIETAIANGNNETGLTIMDITKDMDAGDIFYQEKVPIGPDDTVEDLYERFGKRGAVLMTKYLIKIVNGEMKRVSQDDNLAIYCHMITKNDGRLDPEFMSARDCYNKLRAFKHWPKCHLKFHGQDIIILDAKPLDGFAGDEWPDVVSCADHSALQLKLIQNPKSGKRMKVADYLHGLK